MNRREFLKSLFAVATATALPAIDLWGASDEVIDQVWDQLQQRPPNFYVRSWGTITSDPNDDDNYPRSRAELYDIRSPDDLDDLVALGKDHSWVQGYIDDALSSAEVNDLDQLDEDQQYDLLRQVQLWVERGPDERDAEYMTLTGQNGQGNALRYFRDDFEYCDDFNIVIVEGDCPGSSYFAAELRMSVEDANDLAEALALPIRFAWMD